MAERSHAAQPISIAFCALSMVWLACGDGSHTGPGRIHWDRQTCEHCQMVISEHRHAVQIRISGQRNTHAFDDLGCALLWLDEFEEKAPSAGNEGEVEIWARDPSGTNWIDGRNSRFEGEQSTPMAYGFSSAEAGFEFEEVRALVREKERRRRSGVSPVPLHGARGDRVE